jgi:flagellar biosynthesis chaperone FliJ
MSTNEADYQEQISHLEDEVERLKDELADAKAALADEGTDRRVADCAYCQEKRELYGQAQAGLEEVLEKVRPIHVYRNRIEELFCGAAGMVMMKWKKGGK